MPMYTCTVCGTITDRAQCPEHGSRHAGKRWSRNRNSRRQQTFRDAVLKRDGYRCRRCGATDDLRAAHWPIPLRAFDTDDPDAYAPSHGVTLCGDCDRRLDRYAR